MTFLGHLVSYNASFPPLLRSEAQIPQMPYGSVRRFMKGTYTPFILSAKGKTFVLVGAAALLAAGIYGVMQVCDTVSTQYVTLLADGID